MFAKRKRFLNNVLAMRSSIIDFIDLNFSIFVALMLSLAH